MIHIIVYSTTNTAAKMYKKKKKKTKNHFKITQEEGDNGWDSCNTRCGRADPTDCVICAYGGL